MVRQSFELKDNRVYINNRLVDNVSYEGYTDGMRNKVKLIKDGRIIGFLKSSKVAGDDYYSDYAELATKKICALMGIKCADCVLVDVDGLPKTSQELLAEKKSEEFIKTLPPEKQEIARKHREEQAKLTAKQKGVLSYNYLEYKKYKGNKRLNLSQVCDVYKEVTGNEMPSSVNGYVAMINVIKENKEFAEKLGLDGNILIDENFRYEFLKLAMLSFFTGQLDMTKYNIDLCVIDTPDGSRVEIAPLYDNSESFGLSTIVRKLDYSSDDFEYYKNDLVNMIDSYGSQLTVREGTSLDVNDQIAELADVLQKDPMAGEIFNKFKSIDIGSLVDELDTGELGFDLVRLAIEEFYNARVKSVEKVLEATNDKEL